MTPAEMKKVLEETLQMQAQNAVFDGDEGAPASLGRPASAADLERLEAHFEVCGARLPPALRCFFSISDGVEGYMQLEELSLRSARAIVESQSSDRQWDDFAPLYELVIASGRTSAFIGMDKTRADSRGEYPVVMVDESGSRTEYTNFEDLLREQHEFQKNILEANIGDRAELKSD